MAEKRTSAILNRRGKLSRGKGFEGFLSFNIRRDETSLNAKLTLLGKCPNIPIFGHSPPEKCFSAN